MRETADADDETSGRRPALIEKCPALLGQPQCEATAVDRVGGAVDVAGLNERFDRAARRRGSATRSLGDLTERCRLMLGDGGQQRPRGAIGALGLAVVVECFEQRGQARSDSLRGRLIQHFAILQQFRWFDNCRVQLPGWIASADRTPQ